MQGRQLGGLEGSMDPQGFKILVFSLQIVLLKQSYCCKNNTLHRLRPSRITETPTIYWNDATADSSINDQLIKMHNTHS